MLEFDAQEGWMAKRVRFVWRGTRHFLVETGSSIDMGQDAKATQVVDKVQALKHGLLTA